jgi:hypothetical protein
MAAETTTIADVEERAIDGNYGEIFYNGVYQGDITDITGTVVIAKQEIPVAGSDRVVLRRGRVARDGNITILKVDSRFEALILGYAGMTPQERREKRGQGIAVMPGVQLIVKLTDPDSWGTEEIQLRGVKFWQTSIGFAPNAMVTDSIPITWNTESILNAIPRPGEEALLAELGVPAVLDPGATTTYPAAGGTPVI